MNHVDQSDSCDPPSGACSSEFIESSTGMELAFSASDGDAITGLGRELGALGSFIGGGLWIGGTGGGGMIEIGGKG